MYFLYFIIFISIILIVISHFINKFDKLGNKIIYFFKK
jgi:hypothetical protein